MTTVRRRRARVADDDRLIEIVTRTPSPRLLRRLAMVAIAPQYLDPQRPLGTGPYRWVSGRERSPVVLDRVTADRPYLPLYHYTRSALVRRPLAIDVEPGLLVFPQAIRSEAD